MAFFCIFQTIWQVTQQEVLISALFRDIFSSYRYYNPLFLWLTFLGPLSAGYPLLVLNVLNEKPTRFRFSDLLEGGSIFCSYFLIGLTLNFFPLGLLLGIGSCFGGN